MKEVFKHVNRQYQTKYYMSYFILILYKVGNFTTCNQKLCLKTMICVILLFL